jgi:hypothetical protein
MALDTQAINGIPLNPAGMNDNIPLDEQADWFQTRGLHSLNDNSLRRCNGKLLSHKFVSPILAIHGNLRGRLFIETATTLYMFEHIDDAIPT